MITHTERLKACLRGELLDRPPVALWRHFPVDDQRPETLAAAAVQFQQIYDFDLVKVTPASSFCLKDWGAEDAWQGNPEGTRDYTKRVISDPREWATLPELEPNAPYLAAQLECLRQIRRQLRPDTPVLQTIFSPLAQAKNLVGSDSLLAHIRLFPDAVLKGLDTIARTTSRFVSAALETGIDGIFYAIQHAQAHLMTIDEYRLWGLPYDQRVLSLAGGSWCNMLHLHGNNVYFELAAQLPVQIVNWHDRETPPTLARAAKLFRGVLCGGLRQSTLVYEDPAAIAAESAQALLQTGGRSFILSTGCIVPVTAPHGNYMAARRGI